MKRSNIWDSESSEEEMGKKKNKKKGPQKKEGSKPGFVDSESDDCEHDKPARHGVGERTTKKKKPGKKKDFVDSESDDCASAPDQASSPHDSKTCCAAVAQDQKEDPITMLPLQFGRTVTIISPDGTSQLTYNIETLKMAAVSKGKWMQPPHFREPMTAELLQLIRSIDKRTVDSVVLQEPKRNPEVSDLDAHIIEELIRGEDDPFHQHNERFAETLNAFNGGRVQQKSLYFCPYCWDAAVDDARSEATSSGSEAKQSSSSSSSSPTENLFGKKVEIDSDSSDESIEIDIVSSSSSAKSSRPASSSTSTSFADGQLLNTDIIEGRTVAKRGASSDDSTSIAAKRSKYGVLNPLRALWHLPNREVAWRSILFKDLRQAHQHIKTAHGGDGKENVDNLKDQVMRFIESGNKRLQSKKWFSFLREQDYNMLRSTTHCFWRNSSHYNTMRYNTMVEITNAPLPEGVTTTMFVQNGKDNQAAVEDERAFIKDESSDGTEDSNDKKRKKGEESSEEEPEWIQRKKKKRAK